MAELKIESMVIGSVQTNCYYLYRKGSTEVIFVDPAEHGKQLCEKLEEKGLHVAAIFLTHGHFDHILGVEEMKSHTGAEVYAYEGEKEVLEDSTLNLSAQVGASCKIAADHYLKNGETVTAAGMTCEVLSTPGHTKGSCCYYFKEDKVLISGDTLFEESCGRTDLETGSGSQMYHSLKEILMKLPADVKVYPGHGGSTTISHELQYNPYCQ